MDLKIFKICIVLATTFDFGKTGSTTEQVQIYYSTTNDSGIVTGLVLATPNALEARVSTKSIRFPSANVFVQTIIAGLNKRGLLFVWSEKATATPNIAILDKQDAYTEKLPVLNFGRADVAVFLDAIILTVKHKPGIPIPKNLT